MPRLSPVTAALISWLPWVCRYVDSENCPKGNDASMVPMTDE